MKKSIILTTLNLVILFVSVLSASAQAINVSTFKPDGLILSTGNIYFTSHDAVGAAVWRTGQNSKPGKEAILYWEPGARFGDIVFAQIGNNFFGYFFAKTNNNNVITIKRVPLTGGAATILATITNVDIENSHRNLATDGVNLYWQDDVAIRKMPINGGAITVLDNTRPNTPTAGIVLHNENIIYADGNEIRFVPTAGAVTSPQVRKIATASDRVTSLHAVGNEVFWGELNGVVRRKVGSTIQPLVSSGRVPTSVSSVLGGTIAWSSCSQTLCTLRATKGTLLLSFVSGLDALGVTVVAPNSVFWGDANGVHRRIVN